MDRLEWEVELKLGSSEHELCLVQVQVENKALSGAACICVIFIPQLTLTCSLSAQSTSKDTRCSEKLAYRALQFYKLTNFYTHLY